MIHIQSILLFVSVVLGSSVPLVLAQDTLAGDNSTGLTNGSSTGSNNDNTTYMYDDDFHALTGCDSALKLAEFGQSYRCGNQPLCDQCQSSNSVDSVSCESSREYCAEGVCGKYVTVGEYVDQGENISKIQDIRFVFTSGNTGEIHYNFAGGSECSVDINNKTCTSCAVSSVCPDRDPNSTGLAIQVDCSNLGAGTLDTCQSPDYGLTAGSSLIGLVIVFLDDCDLSAGGNTDSTAGNNNTTGTGTGNNNTGGTKRGNGTGTSNAPASIRAARPFGFGLLSLGLAVFVFSTVL